MGVGREVILLRTLKEISVDKIARIDSEPAARNPEQSSVSHDLAINDVKTLRYQRWITRLFRVVDEIYGSNVFVMAIFTFPIMLALRNTLATSIFSLQMLLFIGSLIARSIWCSQGLNVDAIVRSKEVQSVGDLVDLLETRGSASYIGDERVEAIKTGLTALLREIRPEDINMLSPLQRKRLYWYLMSSDTHLVLALLQALQYIGDNDALSAICKLEAGNWSAARNEEVRTAAKECREAIEERAQQAADPRNLLRASSVTSSSDEMLRPAYQASIPPEETDQLLRSAGTSDSTGSQTIV